MIRAIGLIAKIQLVEFIFLADLYTVKWTGKPLTQLQWYRHHFGPWHEDIQTALNDMNGHDVSFEREARGENTATLVRVGPHAPTLDSLDLPNRLGFMLDNIHREWAGAGQDVLKNLLDYVYDTEPMKAVIDRSPADRAPLNLDLERAKWSTEG